MRNYGTEPASFPVALTIGDYCDSQHVSNLPSESTACVSFAPWTAFPMGTHDVFCNTLADSDICYNNDIKTGVVDIQVLDLGVAAIRNPIVVTDTLPFAPSIKVRNSGSSSQHVRACCRIADAEGRLVYCNIADRTAMLEPGYTALVDFALWEGHRRVGRYSIVVYTLLADDGHPENDTLHASFVVSTGAALARGWSRRPDMPSGPHGLRNRIGGCLTAGEDSLIHVLKGGSYEFFSYNPHYDVWIPRQSLSSVLGDAVRRPVRKGASLCWLRYSKKITRLYLFRGGRANELWLYQISSDTWRRAQAASGARGGGGVSLISVTGPGTSDRPYLYLLRGARTVSFLRSYRGGSWEELKDAVPRGESLGRPFKDGSCLVYDRAYTVYALKSFTNELLAYDLTTQSWSRRKGLPMIGRSGVRRRVEDGGGMACVPGEPETTACRVEHSANETRPWSPGHIYALKGGGCNEVWVYDCAQDSWYQFEDVPAGPGRTRVRSGGAIVYSPTRNALFVTKGGNTLEFWSCYFGLVDPRPKSSDGAMAESPCPLAVPGLTVIPNPCAQFSDISFYLPGPGRVSLRLFDGTGRNVRTLIDQPEAAGTHVFRLEFSRAGRPGLALGAYVLVLETGNQRAVRKLIVQ